MLKGSIFSGRPFSSPLLSYATLIAQTPPLFTHVCSAHRTRPRHPSRRFLVLSRRMRHTWFVFYFLYFCRRWRFRAETNDAFLAVLSVFVVLRFILVRRLPPNKTAHNQIRAQRKRDYVGRTTASVLNVVVQIAVGR